MGGFFPLRCKAVGTYILVVQEGAARSRDTTSCIVDGASLEISAAAAAGAVRQASCQVTDNPARHGRWTGKQASDSVLMCKARGALMQHNTPHHSQAEGEQQPSRRPGRPAQTDSTTSPRPAPSSQAGHRGTEDSHTIGRRSLRYNQRQQPLRLHTLRKYLRTTWPSQVRRQPEPMTP